MNTSSRRNRVSAETESEPEIERIKDDLLTTFEQGSHPDPTKDRIIKQAVQVAFQEDKDLLAMVEEALAFEKQSQKRTL